MAKDKGIVGKMTTWQEYRDAVVALTEHLTGKKPVRDDKHWQDSFARLQKKVASGGSGSS